MRPYSNILLSSTVIHKNKLQNFFTRICITIILYGEYMARIDLNENIVTQKFKDKINTHYGNGASIKNM